jgi:hypothetical protein
MTKTKNAYSIRFSSSIEEDKILEINVSEPTTIAVRRDGRGHDIKLNKEEYLRFIKWQLSFLTVDEREDVLDFAVQYQLISLQGSPTNEK